MKLAISNIGFASADDERVYDLLRAYGFAGLEIAPTRFVGEQPYNRCEEAAEKARWLKAGWGLEIPSMQSIWYGQAGSIFVPQEAAALADYTAAAAAFAAAVHCPSMVFGNPRQRNIPKGRCPEDALGFFETICSAAARHHVVVAMEANAPAYGTNFCNQTQEAFAWAARVPGMMVNYDLGTDLAAGSLTRLDEKKIEQISHVHISEPGLAPVQVRAQHRELAAMLRAGGYNRFVSIEMKACAPSEIEPVLEKVAEVFQ